MFINAENYGLSIDIDVGIASEIIALYPCLLITTFVTAFI
jgi:hypothetical protein